MEKEYLKVYFESPEGVDFEGGEFMGMSYVSLSSISTVVIDGAWENWYESTAYTETVNQRMRHFIKEMGAEQEGKFLMYPVTIMTRQSSRENGNTLAGTRIEGYVTAEALGNLKKLLDSKSI